ncbi:MAG: class I SAM-dependent methyltransferase [Thermoplasmata archaeon]|nr:class I SAM-dependent methyltransferase [Thermoplasmata archaeon]
MKFDQSVDIDLLPEVYNPSDDSYLLLQAIEVGEGERFLEMGSGSGLIAIHAAKAGADVVAADISPHAVECTRRNALRNGAQIEVVQSDLFENVRGNFDVIAFNPPYLAVEETSSSWIEKSWSGGEDGADVAGPFLEQASKHLTPNGRIYIILSSLGGLRTLLRAAKKQYQSALIEEKHMFFESIFAYRLEPDI